MGVFGGKKKDTGVPSEPGAYQVYGENDENLPVAVPIEATVVRPTAPPDSKKGYGSASNQPLIIKTTTTTTTPPISQQQQQQQPTPVVAGNFRRYPVLMQACPQCQQRARTKTRTFPNIWTWLAMIGVGVIFLPLFWIPYVVIVSNRQIIFVKVAEPKLVQFMLLVNVVKNDKDGNAENSD
eukprot:CAMPEP_0194202092 /NCGR_PEP_ID=MMETSP0156-20130528/2201_1 /TAXON_ID=33649 /ORGANISM="Thalassionema nitzschioides, Strain L26-B" /LENGTH=180 /DNA_ID=CAMNT_0038927471 /DNA_START=39 /DNA_END=582 /DNA_ORIENTATION=+